MPNTFEDAVSLLKQKSGKKESLEEAYRLVTARFRGHRLKTYTKAFEIFLTDIPTLWTQNRFLHCTQMNTILEELLIQSGFFSRNDIRKKWTAIWFLTPHQFLEVNLGNGEWVDIDPWSAIFGIPFGDHAHGFHTGKIMAK